MWKRSTFMTSFIWFCSSTAEKLGHCIFICSCWRRCVFLELASCNHGVRGGLCTSYIFYHRRALDGLWRENRGSVNRLQIIVEKNGKLNLYWASTSIKRSRPPFCRSNESFSIVVNSIKRPSSTWRTKFSYILRIWWRQSEIEGDGRLWTSNAAPVACSFKIKWCF